MLPDLLTLPLVVFGLFTAALSDPDGLLDRALGAVLGYLVFLAIAAAYQVVRGREGLGGGDAKILGAAGAWVGVAALPQVILAASLAALLAASFLCLSGVRLHVHSTLPFGPFIGVALWAVWLSGLISL
jgi:leader peptidase (prepilin peptidase)/N-methyltransferase